MWLLHIECPLDMECDDMLPLVGLAHGEAMACGDDMEWPVI
ncbi:MAG: hypothetical protein ACXVAG_17730 [Vulcanimicrobiaceae bacterium]